MPAQMIPHFMMYILYHSVHTSLVFVLLSSIHDERHHIPSVVVRDEDAQAKEFIRRIWALIDGRHDLKIPQTNITMTLCSYYELLGLFAPLVPVNWNATRARQSLKDTA